MFSLFFKEFCEQIKQPGDQRSCYSRSGLSVCRNVFREQRDIFTYFILWTRYLDIAYITVLEVSTIPWKNPKVGVDMHGPEAEILRMSFSLRLPVWVFSHTACLSVLSVLTLFTLISVSSCLGKTPEPF